MPARDRATEYSEQECRHPVFLDDFRFRTDVLNPVFVNDPEKYHPFAGDGMIHEVVFRDGQATYINRFVDTDGLRLI